MGVKGPDNSSGLAIEKQLAVDIATLAKNLWFHINTGEYVMSLPQYSPNCASTATLYGDKVNAEIAGEFSYLNFSAFSLASSSR